jgi:hypothetical protein
MMTIAEKKVQHEIQSIDAKLKIARSKRWAAWNRDDAESVNDLTCDINELLDARLELTGRVIA